MVDMEEHRCMLKEVDCCTLEEVDCCTLEGVDYCMSVEHKVVDMMRAYIDNQQHNTSFFCNSEHLLQLQPK